MLLVVLLGHVDLSVGSVMAFVGAIAGVLMVNNGMSPWVAAIMCTDWCVDWRLARFLGSLCGDSCFIVTLSGLLMFRGLTQVVLGGQSLAPFPTSFQKFQQAIYLILSAAIIFISFQ